MVNMWRGAVVLGAIASIAALPSAVDAAEDCAGGAVRCGDGSCAGAELVCDGTLDCADGADEVLELCRESGRPLFALILLCQQPWSPLHDALCPEVCREWPGYCYYAIGAEHGAPGTCVLPQPSKRGAYSIVDVEPRGRGPADFSLAFVCPRGYRLQGEQPRCVRGTWTSDFPTCALAMFPAPSVVTAKPNTNLIRSNSCVLPESPENGVYVVNNASSPAVPGQVTPGATLTVHCNPGYMAFDSSSYCISGTWIPENLPKCTQFCQLPIYTGTTYMFLSREDGTTRLRPCPEVVPSGTAVVTQCEPYYYYSGNSPDMRCLNRSWVNIAICQPECGVLTPSGEPLVVGGQASVHSPIPWHAVVYEKTSIHVQVCGGSLVSTRVVISAANCFWISGYGWGDEQLRSSDDFVVAVGKVYRAWGDPLRHGTQTSVQTSDVREIKVPDRFMGSTFFIIHDIALMILATPVGFNTFVKPVCLDFHRQFENLQLRKGKMGKILSWASENDDQPASNILNLRSLPFVDRETCMANGGYLKKDKFCASSQGTGLCFGDSGVGISFPANNTGKQRHYLRGVAFDTPDREGECGRNNFIVFTNILYHENFIKKYIRS